MPARKKSAVTLTGIVIPTEWDEEQRLVGVSLATADEKEYRIGATKKGRELFHYLQQQVEIAGDLSLDENGRPVITVRRYYPKQGPP